MAARLNPALLSSRTVFAARASAISAAAPAASSTVYASKSAKPATFKASLLDRAALTSRTPFAAGFQKRNYANPSYINPVKITSNGGDTFTPPDNTSYHVKNYNEDSSRTFAYFMVGSLSFVGAAAAKNIVTDYISHFTASADVMAMASVEVDLATIPEGKNLIIKWRGKPIFIRHRTSEEISEANSVSIAELRHQEADADRTKKPDWLVMIGVCTHLGCVPIGEAGEYNGWFCPCHGSHYDISGRIRKGPAPLNLEIPPYNFIEDDTKMLIG